MLQVLMEEVEHAGWISNNQNTIDDIQELDLEQILNVEDNSPYQKRKVS